MIYVIVGALFGDEGKGKIASYLARKFNYLVRTGAINAGHTVLHEGKEYKLRALPSGMVTNKEAKGLIAAGALISVEVLKKEMKELGLDRNRVVIDKHTGIIEEKHKEMERTDETLRRIGSTFQGVGAAMAERVLRKLRLAKDVPEVEEIAEVGDVADVIMENVDKGVLIEGTQGYFLSLYHGTYPYVTSRDTTASAVLSEVGLGPKWADEVVVVTKAFVTRVGEGPLRGELPKEVAERLGFVERGTVTGRPRRAARLEDNIDLLKRAVRANSATKVAITKVDVLFPKARGARSWRELPMEARAWISDVESELGVPICYIGTGPEAMETIERC